MIASSRQRQLLVDVSIIAMHDAGTGIQRVVRSILIALFEMPPQDVEIRLVRATRKRTYVYANQYAAALTGAEPMCDSPITVTNGDIFLGLDLSSRIAPRRQRDFLLWRKQGVKCAFVVYDLLPVLHPQWFTKRASRSFRRWLSTIVIHADALFCISRVVATDAASHMVLTFGIDDTELKIKWFHLGTNVSSQASDLSGLDSLPSASHSEVPRELTILMVGTIEPRKGYAQVLDAFELLWLKGVNAKLIIVGRPGWHVDELIDRLQRHVESGKRLKWLSTADDKELDGLYKTADGLVMASEAEGFGLPLVEATRHGVPLLVRDLAVFREVVADCATYFHASNGTELARQLHCWLDALVDGSAIASNSAMPLTWRDSAAQLKHLIAQLCDLNHSN